MEAAGGRAVIEIMNQAMTVIRVFRAGRRLIIRPMPPAPAEAIKDFRRFKDFIIDVELPVGGYISSHIR